MIDLAERLWSWVNNHNSTLMVYSWLHLIYINPQGRQSFSQILGHIYISVFTLTYQPVSQYMLLSYIAFYLENKNHRKKKNHTIILSGFLRTFWAINKNNFPRQYFSQEHNTSDKVLFSFILANFVNTCSWNSLL